MVIYFPQHTPSTCISRDCPWFAFSEFCRRKSFLKTFNNTGIFPIDTCATKLFEINIFEVLASNVESTRRDGENGRGIKSKGEEQSRGGGG